MVSKHFEDIKIKFVEDTDLTAKIVAEPFERGYAVTVGNALRRALMTSVPGAAIVSVKIDGVQHEFSNIKGILEDVSDVVLNLKEVILKTVNDGPEQISLSLEGPMEFKAKHIQELIKLPVLYPEIFQGSWVKIVSTGRIREPGGPWRKRTDVLLIYILLVYS